MTEDEYLKRKNAGDERVGRCPYCHKPGWIVEGRDWCEHVVGTFDCLMCSEPFLPLVEGPEFDEFRSVLDSLHGASERRVSHILSLLPRSSRSFLMRALDMCTEMFWMPFVRCRCLTVHLHESLCSTTYKAYFTRDPARARAGLHRRAQETLHALRRVGVLDKLLQSK